MWFCIFSASWFILLIHGKYLLIDVDGNDDDVIMEPPIYQFMNQSNQPFIKGPTFQCSTSLDFPWQSPYDSCNHCECKDDCISSFCSKADCLDEEQNYKMEEQHCSLRLQNCADGLKCAKCHDACHNDVGVCYKEPVGTACQVEPAPLIKTMIPNPEPKPSDFKSGKIDYSEDLAEAEGQCEWKDLDGKCLKSSCSALHGASGNSKGEKICNCRGKRCDLTCKDCEVKAKAEGKSQWTCPCGL